MNEILELMEFGNDGVWEWIGRICEDDELRYGEKVNEC